jgi:NADPH2:quinone reductase
VKGVRVHAPGRPEVLRWEDVPDPVPGPGEVVVRVEVAGVNYIDVYCRSGLYRRPLPFTAGFEAAGTVVAAAEGVEAARVGDRVAYTHVPGGYAELAAVPAERLVPLPGDLDARQGATAMDQGMTAHYLATTTYPLGPGDTCLVHAAAGGVGLLLTQVAKLRGARVLATVSTEAKAAVARAAGADEVVLYGGGRDFVAGVRRLTGGRGVEVVYDGVGRATFEASLDCVAVRGLLVLYGQTSGPVPPQALDGLARRGSLRLTRPSLVHHVASRDELLRRAGEVLGWIRDGRLRLRLEHVYPLEAAVEAHRALEGRRTTGKVLLLP